MKSSAGRPARVRARPGHLPPLALAMAMEAAPRAARMVWRDIARPHDPPGCADAYRMDAGALAVALAGALVLADKEQPDAECARWVERCDLLAAALRSRDDATWAELGRRGRARVEAVRASHLARMLGRCEPLPRHSPWRWLLIEETAIKWRALYAARGGGRP